MAAFPCPPPTESGTTGFSKRLSDGILRLVRNIQAQNR
jgi:hypothetical protein